MGAAQQELHMKIESHSGEDNVIVDTLSRHLYQMGFSIVESEMSHHMSYWEFKKETH